MSKAIVVGSINMDVVAFVKNHPKIGETVFGREVRYMPGGKGSNQAIACKRLGSETLMVGRVGDDAFGEQLLVFQMQDGIDVAGVKCLKNIATGTAFVTVSEGAENAIVVIAGANAVWDDGFLDDVQIEAGDIVLAQFEVPDQVISQAFRKARDCGAMTVLNPAPARAIDSGIRQLTDLLIVNEHELAELAGVAINADNDESVFNAAEWLANDGYGAVIVTLGNKGVRVLHAGQRYSMAARPVTAVDTTGAGDTFVGGLAAGLLSGLDLVRAAEFGNVAASISVTRPGAAASIPTIEEVNRILKTGKMQH